MNDDFQKECQDAEILRSNLFIVDELIKVERNGIFLFMVSITACLIGLLYLPDHTRNWDLLIYGGIFINILLILRGQKKIQHLKLERYRLENDLTVFIL